MIARIGLAIVRPRLALATAGERRNAGRSGSDLLVMIVVLLAATQLRALFGAAWLAAAVDWRLGAHAAFQVLTGTLSIDLGVLVLAALIVWVAGIRRGLGRAFDLACVAVLPLVLVELAATTFVRASEIVLPEGTTYVLSGIAYAWTGCLVALAIVAARHSAPRDASPELLRVARTAGWLTVAVAVVGVAMQTLWIAHHLESVRPMQTGAQAPAIALPQIGPRGMLGAPVSLPPGKVTVLDFWATWCGPCLESMPRLDAFTRRHPEVAVLAVNLDDPEEARALFDARRYAMTLVSDDGATSERYGVTSIPHTVVIDRSGMVQHVVHGDGVDLDKVIEALP